MSSECRAVGSREAGGAVRRCWGFFQGGCPTVRPLRLGLPKGRMQAGLTGLMADAGIRVQVGERGYRPSISLPGYEVKLLKPQNIIEMLHQGTRDIGFAGADWVAELKADVEEVLDTGLDPVTMVAAAPLSILEDGQLPRRHLVIASEYQRLTTQWMQDSGLDADFVRSYGATEVFPPEDADCIVDIAATGATLEANSLAIVHRLMKSSTRLYVHKGVMQDAARRDMVETFVMLLRSVLEARGRVMVEINVGPDALETLVKVLPCMREPTVSPLHGQAGFAVKVAVPRSDLPHLIPIVKRHGGTDIVVTALAQIIP
ncbi:MAG TPA: ATP phosphoribosyltransferase [Candidatus Xenobia bacterium]